MGGRIGSKVRLKINSSLLGGKSLQIEPGWGRIRLNSAIKFRVIA
jgi:hypothetical protein